MMPILTRWEGCYREGWQGCIVPEAFAHPAKYARGLMPRLYRHLLAQGYVHRGATVLDPFGGVALGALDAMTYGLRWVGVELEPRFVALAQQNLALWERRYGFTAGMVVQGDARQLRTKLAVAPVPCVVSSPPYAGAGKPDARNMHFDNQVTADGRTRREASIAVKQANGVPDTYGSTPGQLANMVVSSLPYADSWHAGNGIDQAKLTGNPAGIHTQAKADGYGRSAGQLGAMPAGVVSSPPYAQGLSKEHTYTDHAKRDKASHRRIMTEKGIVDPFYGTSEGQLNNMPDTFWSAASTIMAEVAALLPAGSVAAWVVKAYVSKGRLVDFPGQWCQLCEAHGFRLVEEIHASLVETYGTQEGLFGEADTVEIKRCSFFRRLAERKGSPRIDHETILILTKEP